MPARPAKRALRAKKRPAAAPTQSPKPAKPVRKPADPVQVIELLKTRYGEARCALNHTSAFELLVATILSAQTTDKRVNMIAPALFARYPTPQALATATPEEVEPYVRSTNFFRNKAKNLVGMAKGLVEKHGGEVPRTLEELIELPGVARKTANVVLGTWYRIAIGLVVDTHVTRLANLLGLTHESDAVKIERDLMRIVPPTEWIQFSHMLIHHGREVCIARRPKCAECMLNRICPSATI